MGSKTTEAPHVLLVCFPGQGHVNPFLRFAKRLASKGLLVTFSSTNSIGARMITSSTKSEPETLIPIGKGHLRFEFFSDGWEDVHDPRRLNLPLLMHQLRTVSAAELSNLIRRHSDLGSPISCVINNTFIPWVVDVAYSFSIPSACLSVQSGFFFSIEYHYFHKTVPFPTESNPDVLLQLPGIPSLTPDEIPSFLLDSSPLDLEIRELNLAQFRNIEKLTWVFANTFEELERESITAISATVPYIAVGPLLDGAKSEHVRGDLVMAEDCVDWLNSKEAGSVVYISLGSMVVLTKEEMWEMADGLLNCGQPFLWVVRESSRSLLPDGFIEEAESCGRGKVVSWSPQEEVLFHSAVGSFVTHCGWNSTLEALAAGVTLVTYPQMWDQVLNSKFLVDVYEVGVRLKSPVKKEDLQRCVEEVMRGKKAEKLKGNALKWKQAAGKAVAEGGSSDRNIQAFVDEILKRRRLSTTCDQ